MRSDRLMTLTIGFILLVIPHPTLAFDFSEWDRLLKKYVESKTIDGVTLNAVDYKKLAQDPLYMRAIKGLENISLSELKTREEQLAFWINAYNIMAVKMVIDHYPLKSIKDAGSFFTSVWKKDVGKVAGTTRTLHEIEHEILRKMGEPRIHAAIVCASVSCPDLRQEAFTAEKVDQQLDDQVRTFLANSQKGLRLDLRNKTLNLSSIFDWFEEDFESQGGVLQFIKPYTPPSVKDKLKSSTLEVEYMDYNWRLNEA